MKTIGLLGGMGPASTLLYYQALCELTRQRLGGNASPPVLIHAFDFGAMQALQEVGAWDEIGALLLAGAKGLLDAGADFIILATNTMHKTDWMIEGRLGAPFLHIADAVGARLKADGRSRAAIMGTRYTMEEDFLTGRITGVTGHEIMVPTEAHRTLIQARIFDELVKGIVTPGTVADFIGIAEDLKNASADSLILGCTEIGLVLNSDNSPLPVYDTARIHCEDAIDMATSDWTY